MYSQHGNMSRNNLKVCALLGELRRMDEVEPGECIPL